MSVELAVDGCALEHDTGSLISGGSFTITSVPSTVTKEDNKGVYTTPMTYTFSGGSAAGFVANTVMTTAPAVIAATAIKTKDNFLPVMRKGDSGVMTCIGTLPPPTGGTAPVAGPVKIGDAGQTKVKGD